MITKEEYLRLLIYDIDKGFKEIPMDSELKRDKDIIEAAIDLSSYEAYQHMHLEDAKNPEYFLKCLNKCRSCLLFRFAPPEIQGNREVALEAIKWIDSGFQYVSMKLRGDRDFAIELIKRNNGGLKYISEPLRHDIEILNLAISLNGYDYKWAPDVYKNDYNLAKLAVANGCSIIFLPKKYQGKKEFKLLSVKRNVHALSLFKPRQRDKEIILTALIYHGKEAWYYLSEELKLDPTYQLASESCDYARMLLDMYHAERKEKKNAKSNR